MAPSIITPEASGTSTPTGTSASALTKAGIKHIIAAREATNGAKIARLDASRMTVELTTSPRAVPELDSAETQALRTCTDHMITAQWTEANGWEAPQIRPYGPLSIMPTASVLQYATECFEGLKLYRGYDGRLRLFRVERNSARMRTSATRIALPDFEPGELQKLIVALCARDGPKWLPKSRAGTFLYLRPTCIANDPALGVQRPTEALLYIMLVCMPAKSYTIGPPVEATSVNGRPPAGMSLIASEEDSIRAWPGGFGNAKVGANYGPTLVAQGEARSRGFDQVLWLFGDEGYVTEAGGSNFFVVWRSEETGKLELVTAPLWERIILNGVTRASIIDLAREVLQTSQDGMIEGLEVVERRFTMAELLEAYQEGRLVEAFAAGTAVFIAPVAKIHFRGQDIVFPLEGEGGVYARTFSTMLEDIMYGNKQHEWGVVVDEVEP